MGAGANASDRRNKLFGAAGLVMALCCLAGPAVVGAAAGAAIGNLIGVVAAVVIAVSSVALLRWWRSGTNKAC
jgi:hypothetical protein